MTEISGTTRGSSQPLSQEELQALQRNASTSTIVNEARKRAGFVEPPLLLRASDPTLGQVLEERKYHGLGEAIGAATHGIDLVEALGLSLGARALLGVTLPLVAFGAAQATLYGMEKQKLDTRDAATRDQMKAAILDTLDLPAEFKSREVGRLDVSFHAQGAAKRMSRELATSDRALVVTLQFHCDQGIHAARGSMAAGQSSEAFLAAHPEAKQRYDADPAFRNGFDAVVWAKAQPTDAALQALASGLEARDARYVQANVSYRL